jgi:hypothetical protein
MSADEVRLDRYAKFRQLGQWEEFLVAGGKNKEAREALATGERPALPGPGWQLGGGGLYFNAAGQRGWWAGCVASCASCQSGSSVAPPACSTSSPAPCCVAARAWCSMRFCGLPSPPRSSGCADRRRHLGPHRRRRQVH